MPLQEVKAAKETEKGCQRGRGNEALLRKPRKEGDGGRESGPLNFTLLRGQVRRGPEESSRLVAFRKAINSAWV